MFGNVQHTIQDARYRDALKRIGDTPPEADFRIPNEEQYRAFLGSRHINLEYIMDSPIAVYMFKRYLNKFLNFTIVVDFLIQYERLKKLEAPDLIELENLVDLAVDLPGQYSKEVEEIQRQLKLIQANSSEYAGTEAADLVVAETADPVLSASHFSDGKSRRRFRKPGAKILQKLQVRNGGFDETARRVLSFGGFSSIYAGKTEKREEAQILSAFEFEAETPAKSKDTNVDRQPSSAATLESTKDNSLEMEDSAEELETNRDFAHMREEFFDLHSAKEMLMGLFEDLGQTLEKKGNELVATFRESKEYRRMINIIWYSEQIPVEGDFKRYRALGKGAFGVVSSVIHRSTGQLTAMKMMSKRLIKGKKAHTLVKTEKNILQILGDNPSTFTIWLKYAFQDEDYFYMALPLCTGGDLAYHLKNAGTFDVDRIRFYAAEILEGLAHLHSLGILYRDLKPENVILDTEGHCRLSDMGLASVTNGIRIKSRAGTPGYWAPEVILKKFYSFSVDFWSLGVVMFEFILGICPFSQTHSKMERDQATCYWRIQYPKVIENGSDNDRTKKPIAFPEDLKNLIQGLLRRRQAQRLGLYEVRSHPFFRSISWEKLKQRQVDPPYVPSDNINATDAKYLDYNITEKEYKNINLTRRDEIENFDYISKYAHELDIVNVLEARTDGKFVFKTMKNRKKTGKGRKNGKKKGLSEKKSLMSTQLPGTPRELKVGNGCVLM